MACCTGMACRCWSGIRQLQKVEASIYPFVPAEAGTQSWAKCNKNWIPAFAGMSGDWGLLAIQTRKKRNVRALSKAARRHAAHRPHRLFADHATRAAEAAGRRAHGGVDRH